MGRRTRQYHIIIKTAIAGLFAAFMDVRNNNNIGISALRTMCERRNIMTRMMCTIIVFADRSETRHDDDNNMTWLAGRNDRLSRSSLRPDGENIILYDRKRRQ